MRDREENETLEYLNAEEEFLIQHKPKDAQCQVDSNQIFKGLQAATWKDKHQGVTTVYMMHTIRYTELHLLYLNTTTVPLITDKTE